MSELETFMKELYKKQNEITKYERKLPDGGREKKEILSIEVSDHLWSVLIKHDGFKSSVDKGIPNIGAYPVKKVSDLKDSNFEVLHRSYIRPPNSPWWVKFY